MKVKGPTGEVAGQAVEAARDAAEAVEGADASAVDGVHGESAASEVAASGDTGATDAAQAADKPSAASLEALGALAADMDTAGSALTTERLQGAVSDVLQADVPGLVAPDAAQLIAEALADDPTFIAALRAGATGEGGS